MGPASVSESLVEDAQHGLLLLHRSVLTKLPTKLPRPASNSWIGDLHQRFADLHLPLFHAQQQHLEQEEIAACKVHDASAS